MMTVKQVAARTGVSIRTLRFYDGIGLLKPTAVSPAGYRLYDEAALETLQQILFFKELDFTLKEIQAILEDPGFDKTAAFRRQHRLLELKRDRLNGLLDLLDRLIQGEPCMDFQAFDLSAYFDMLEDFKKNRPEEISQRFGSLAQFDEMVARMKDTDGTMAELAVKQYGSLEKYTRAMENNLSRYLSEGPPYTREEATEIVRRTEEIVRRLTADPTRDPADPEVQQNVAQWLAYQRETSKGLDMGAHYWEMLAEMYQTEPMFLQATDKKFGAGASRFLGRALQRYLEQNGAARHDPQA